MGHVLLVSSIFSVSYNLSSPVGFPKLLREEPNYDSQFRPAIFIISSCVCLCTWSYLLLKEASLVMTKQSTILMTISVGIISLTSFFIFFLILTNYIWLYPRSLNYPISCSWTYKQCKAWLPSHSMDLKSDQTLVGHSHKWHATIAPTHLTVFITVH